MKVDPISQIVDEVADREGVEPIALDPPLGEVVNTNLLDAIATDHERSGDGGSATLEFEYHGYSVTIDTEGAVDISDPSRAPNERPGAGSSRTPEPGLDRTADRDHVVKTVADIIAARQRPFAERLDGLLHVVRKALQLEAATLSYVEAGSYVFESVDVAAGVDIQVGEVVDLKDTVCKRVVESEQAVVLRDVEVDAPELAGSALGVACYLGVPVIVDGRVYGTFCFYDEEPRAEAFSEWELAFVELLSNWVRSELEGRRREWALQRQRSERPHTTS